MSLAKKKKDFIRWYYGSFVNDPHSEIIMFGAVRPLGAIRLSRILKRLGLKLPR